MFTGKRLQSGSLFTAKVLKTVSLVISSSCFPRSLNSGFCVSTALPIVKKKKKPMDVPQYSSTNSSVVLEMMAPSLKLLPFSAFLIFPPCLPWLSCGPSGNLRHLPLLHPTLPTFIITRSHNSLHLHSASSWDPYHDRLMHLVCILLGSHKSS